eukprot:gene32087-41607_t
MKVLGVLIAIQVALPIATSLIFKKNINFRKSSPTFSTVASGDASATWQEQLDQILDVDTPCEGRRELSINILKRASEITSDLAAALQDRDINKLAPKNLAYGKALIGLQAFQKQIVNDIIPDLLTKTVPKLIDETPKIINSLSEKGPNQISTDLLKKSQDVLTTVRDISQDPSMLQSTIDDLRRELKNVVKSTPIGIDEPAFTVLKTVATAEESSYEIRRYEGYSICSISISSIADISSSSSEANPDTPIMDIVSSSKSFTTLAGYIFGENANDQKLTMTTPVILETGVMSFVLPKGVSAESAPLPNSDKIALRDLSAGSQVAVRTFTGIATEGEVSRQKAKLEEALTADGIEYDSSSFKVLQYNPPVRRNEVSFSVSFKNDFVAEGDASNFFSSPEAGD